MKPSCAQQVHPIGPPGGFVALGSLSHAHTSRLTAKITVIAFLNVMGVQPKLETRFNIVYREGQDDCDFPVAQREGRARKDHRGVGERFVNENARLRNGAVRPAISRCVLRNAAQVTVNRRERGRGRGTGRRLERGRVGFFSSHELLDDLQNPLIPGDAVGDPGASGDGPAVFHVPVVGADQRRRV